jgi:hypothetical protein
MGGYACPQLLRLFASCRSICHRICAGDNWNTRDKPETADETARAQAGATGRRPGWCADCCCRTSGTKRGSCALAREVNMQRTQRIEWSNAENKLSSSSITVQHLPTQQRVVLAWFLRQQAAKQNRAGIVLERDIPTIVFR